MCAETYAYTNLYFDKFSEIFFISLVKFQIFQKRFNYVHGKASSPCSTVVVLKFSLQKTQPN